MIRKATLCCAILVVALLTLSLTFGNVSAADQNPCSEDIAKYCNNIKPGHAAMMECLEEHETQLSDACKEYEAKMERPRAESREPAMQLMKVREACKDDTAKFCGGVTSGMGGVTACLRQHKGDLSAPCGDAVKAAGGGEEERTAE